MLEAVLVSCDDHLDLNMLPANVLADRMASKWGERAPQVQVPDEGPASWIADGNRWGFWSGKKVERTGPLPICKLVVTCAVSGR